MSLLQIAEPNQSAKPHEHKFALGIDLGTTRSMVATVRSGKAQLLEAQNAIDSNSSTTASRDNGDSDSNAFNSDTSDLADKLLPSVVYYGHLNGVKTPIIGTKALEYFQVDPANTIVSAKRFMGRSREDIKFSHPYKLNVSDSDTNAMPTFSTAQGEISPVAVSAEILKVLFDRSKQALPFGSIKGAVITVPAYFDEAQRQATKDAAKLAGINVLRLLNEPTAAAVAYGLDEQSLSNHQSESEANKDSNMPNSEKIFLIYDLGGGTFDVSILKMSNGVFEVLATGGNSALGGDDIDRLIMGWLLKQADISIQDIDATQRSQIARSAEAYKILLTTQNTVDVSLNIKDINWQGHLSTHDLENIIGPITRRTLALCDQVMRDANIDSTGLDEVILVGGSTRMPTIQNIVAKHFNKPPLAHLDPDQVVALGAAQVADQLIKTDKTNNTLLLDVTPLSLGLETMGGLVETIIPRNTPIPVTKKQTFTTYQDGQTGMVIHVVQGERDTVESNRSLGRFELFGIPPMKAGLARIEVTFSIDADGQLTVSAIEATSGIKSDIHITPTYGLSEEQQEQLLRAGMENAEYDKLSRSLIEAKVEAKREVLALHSALEEYDSLLSQDERTKLTQAIKDLEHLLNTMELDAKVDNDILIQFKSDLDAVQLKLKPLSDDFAAKIMNKSISQSLAGTSTSDWTN